ncbi:MAG: glycosyltransferase family 39 protein, partial [Myxococcales bacterium]|nr:glycosyltransferase family 39 protein [Myxococcales bacterium]
MGSERWSLRRVTALLGLVMLIAAAPRLWHIERRGPFVLDEAVFVLEGQWIVSLAQALGKSIELRREEGRTGADVWKLENEIQKFREIRGIPLYYGRPMHSLLVGLTSLAVGFRPWAGALCSAVFSLGCIVLTFLIARRWYSDAVAWVAALLFAVSGYATLYARSALAEMTSNFFLLGSVLAYIYSRERDPERSYPYVIVSGFLWGVAITTHDRWLTMLPLLWVAEMHLWWKVRPVPWGAYVWRALLFHVFLLVPHALFELPYHAALVFARMFDVHLGIQTHWEQVLGNLLRAAKTGGGGFDPMNLLTYPYLMLQFDGPLIPLAYLGGLVFAFRRRQWTDLLLAFWFLYPLAYASLTLARARYASAAFAPGAILGALFLVEWVGPWIARRRAPRWAGTAALALFGAVSLGATAHMIHESRLGYDEAYAFLAKEPTTRHVSTAAMISEVYLGRVAVDPPVDEAEMRARYDEGYRYVVVEPFAYYMKEFV